MAIMNGTLAEGLGLCRRYRSRAESIFRLPCVSGGNEMVLAFAWREGILPIDLGPHHEDVRVNPVIERLVVGCRQLEHPDPVCHEADAGIGIPVEADGHIGLSPALNVGGDAGRLPDKEAAAV